MQIISASPQLLAIAKVTEISLKNLPVILKTITENQIQLDGEASKNLTNFVKSSNEALTIVVQVANAELQKSWEKADENSISHITKLLSALKSSGISDNRIDLLLEKIIDNNHQIQKNRDNNSFWTITVTVVVGILSLMSTINTNTQERNKKYPFWYTR